MNIFIQIKNSIYNKEYYQSTVLNQSLRESIKYLAKLCLLLALLGSIIFAFSLPKLFLNAKNTLTSIAVDYPDDLVVSLKGGNVSINRPEPYIVKMPSNLTKINDSQSAKIDNLIVVNTTEPFNLDKFKEYSTFSLLTKSEFISMQNNNGEIKILSLSKFGNMEITKTWILEKEVMIKKILPWLIFLIIPVVYGGMFVGIFIGTLGILFLSAVIVWIISKIKKMNLSYKKSYQVALYASTILLILSIFYRYLEFLNYLFIKLLIFIIIVLINFIDYPVLVKSKEPIVVSPDTEIKN